MTLIIQKALLFWIFVRLVFKTRMFQRRSIMPFFFFFFLNIHSVEKTDDGKDVEESSKPSFTVSQKRKRIPSTSSLVIDDSYTCILNRSWKDLQDKEEALASERESQSSEPDQAPSSCQTHSKGQDKLSP